MGGDPSGPAPAEQILLLILVSAFIFIPSDRENVIYHNHFPEPLSPKKCAQFPHQDPDPMRFALIRPIFVKDEGKIYVL
jgi:hypothetical protein